MGTEARVRMVRRSVCGRIDGGRGSVLQRSYVRKQSDEMVEDWSLQNAVVQAFNQFPCVQSSEKQEHAQN